jgi:hypothetical protein
MNYLYTECGGLGGGQWPNLGYYACICLEELKKYTGNLSQCSPGPIFEPGTLRILNRRVTHSTTTSLNYDSCLTYNFHESLIV